MFEPDKLRTQLAEDLENFNQSKLGRNRYKYLEQQRKRAGMGDHKDPLPTFLRPQDIQKGLEYDIERVFTTTLGGELRRLNKADLQAFTRNIELLKDQYSKGITAKHVINLSLPDIVKRANQQIHTIYPLSIKNDVVEFQTNASKNSAVKYHFVNVKFENYLSILLQTNQVTIEQVRKNITLGKLKIECDCENYTYWYRYMATVGGYGLGRIEEGFPKIRNPKMNGLACKHIISVMGYILSSQGTQYIFKTLEKARKKQAGTRQTRSKKSILAEIDQQLTEIKKPIKQNLKLAEKEMLRRAENVEKKRLKQLEQQARQQAKQTAKEFQNEKNKQALKQMQRLLASNVISKEVFDIFKRGINAK